MTNPKPCQQCGGYMGGKSSMAKYCRKCRADRQLSSVKRSRSLHPVSRGANRAHSAVANAVRKGKLPPPSNFACVDCGSPRAHVYDHRDYNRPLDVQPVCWRCNTRRGAAIPHVDDAAKVARAV